MKKQIREEKNRSCGKVYPSWGKIVAVTAASVTAAVSLSLGLAGCVEEKEYSITFVHTEHVSYSYFDDNEILNAEYGDDQTVMTVKEGVTVKFSLVIDDDYSGEKVRANDNVLSADNNGVYSVTVTEEVRVTVSGITYTPDEPDPVRLKGDGTESSPYLINDLKELRYVADQINAGTNINFILGYYRLENDIDCGGETIDVIGNGISGNSFFGGHFEGNGHKISNYRIESRNGSYAGLFGIVQQYVAPGTAIDYNLGVIENLTIENFTLDVHAPASSNVIAGSLVGFGAAAKIINCNVLNGEIIVTGNNYFSFVGGAVGALQSSTTIGMTSDDNGDAIEFLYSFYGVLSGVHTDVDITATLGYTYSAGGLVGFTIADHAMAPVTVVNSYSTGNIFGAMRAGGVVGTLGSDTSVKNCYSTGEIEASCEAGNPVEEYDALAGGIVAYAEHNTVIASSFSNAELYAYSVNGDKHSVTGDIVARYAPANSTERAIVTYNCYAGDAADADNAAFVKDTLNWSTEDWKIENGALPVLSGKALSDRNFILTVDYSGKTVNSAGNSKVNISANGYYYPIVDFFRYGEVSLNEVLTANDGFTSYGYFFDKNLTQQVPYGYVPTGNETLYVGFADYTVVAGTEEGGKTYYYNNNGRTVELTLYKTGDYVYTDAVSAISTYTFDGETIIFNDAPFARLSKVILTDNDGNLAPNLNYDKYNFAARISEDGLEIYDESFFADNSLNVILTKPTVSADAFEGVWEKSATINKKYTFNNGSWSFSDKGQIVMSGTYTVNEGIASLKSGSADYGTASFDASGLLIVKIGDQQEYFGYANGLLGTWFDSETGDYIRFSGYGSSLTGEVIVSVGNNVSQLLYVRDGFFDEMGDGSSVTLISPSDASLFGYLSFDEKSRTLSGIIYSSTAGGFVEGKNFCLIDNYTGEWIGDGEVGGVDFSLMNFNGLGTYSVSLPDGSKSPLGYIEINGSLQRIDYEVSIDGGLTGKFTYNGVEYALTFDDVKNEVTVSVGSDSATLFRKDELYTYTLADASNTYTFNGGGNLKNGGTLTVENIRGVAAEYTYKIVSGTVADKDIVVSLTNKANGETGSLKISGAYFEFKANVASSTSVNLSIKTAFGGNWAISTISQNFYVSNFDLEGNATGTFQGLEAEYKIVSESCIIVSFYMENSTSLSQAYIVLVDEDTLAISDYPYLVSGAYVYTAKQDVLYGEWTHINLDSQIKFDGLGDSKYVHGSAWDTIKNITYYYTRRFGNFYMWLYNDDSQMYVLNFLPRNTTSTDYYSAGNNRFELLEFSPSDTPICAAKDGETEYNFYIDGSVTIDGISYTYELSSVSGDETTVFIDVDGERVKAVVDSAAKTVVVL